MVDNAHGGPSLVVVKVPTIQQAYINVYPLIPEIGELMRALKKTLVLSPGAFVLNCCFVHAFCALVSPGLSSLDL
jgi:hypothetical protein